METRIDEIAAGIYRFSTFVPEVAAPAGLTYNQFLVLGEEPLLFHCGHRRMFPSIAAALARVMKPEHLRWISFGHIEADECGAMNAWLAVAPHASVAHGGTASRVSLNDMADRPPRALANNEVLDLGGKRVRYLDTPHVPHGWEAGLLFEETTGTLLCGDLFTQTGNGPAISREDVVGPAMAAEDRFGFSSLAPTTGRTVRQLAALAPTRLALMHGPAFEDDCEQALRDLADRYDQRIRAALG